ncbi:protoheme IX farnesyltransferase [Candidatus Kaiserbacteria bacterium]|nr:protoheme IX farnesyltransferase [Candidatus Kaiserbacteria bacterium]
MKTSRAGTSLSLPLRLLSSPYSSAGRSGSCTRSRIARCKSSPTCVSKKISSPNHPMSSEYYHLTKPRMVYMNVLVAAAAFVFASPSLFDWRIFFLMLLGLSFVVASACVFNNYADRLLDQHMERTKTRALAAGRVRPRAAFVFGLLLIVVGTLVLALVNWLTLAAALFGFVVYVFVYTPLKPHSGYALIPGAVAGAMPPVVGYAAAAGVLDLYALGLFLFLFLWQIPHFLAIARYRFDEYSAAGVPLLVRRPQHDRERARARRVFYLSLVLLVLGCLALILQRWIR